MDRQVQIRNLVTLIIGELQAGTFRPEKYTDPKGSRKFTLLPVKSLQAGHIALDLATLPRILRAAGLTTTTVMSQEEFERQLWRNFDFTHLGFESFEDLFTEDIQWR